MGDVEISSHTVPFHLGMVSIGIHGKPIGIELVERRRTGFLSFHKIEEICCDSCILHSKVPWGIVLNAYVSLSAMDILIQFNFIVHIA
jgi:hypothetical protein